MKPDGSIHPTTDKSKVIKLLEDLVMDNNNTSEASTNATENVEGLSTCLVVDGMAGVNGGEKF